MSTRSTMRTRLGRGAVAAAAGLAAATALVACSGDDGAPGGGGDGDGPVQLTYWTWMTNIEDVVGVWNEEHPDVQVKVARLAEGDDLVTRITTAAEAGNLPDLMQVEYQALPILVSNGAVADVTDTVAPLADEFSPAALAQVTWDGQSYAVPGDIGPLMMYVREDRLEDLGLDVPTTWDEFADVAEQVHEADPDAHLTSFDATYPGWFAGLSQQAGAQWWSADGNAWGVDIDDAATTRVASYWSDLVDRGLVSTTPTYSAEWNAAMSTGDQLAWIAPAWGAGVIAGIAEEGSGWTAVPLPQWEPGAEDAGNWGGSSAAISTTTPHPDEAAAFLTWLYTDPEGLAQLVDTAGLYPAAVAGQEYAKGSAVPEILGDQTDFWDLAADAAAHTTEFPWSPNVNYAFTRMQDDFSTSIEQGRPLQDSLRDIDTAITKDLHDQGYPVAED
ncbi:ABC transporter substrate-binding protein [Isoptericola sp. NPDC019693]|uniref:ABC transporter substrate-binding protein n=1 Tax=Isoptericola sp. NPDC019693 TaxID=3364009 RepID=UPI003793E127